jgi:fibrillarin-like pre-rRNA processing protein
MQGFRNPFSEMPGVPGVYTGGRSLLTINAAPGQNVYGEVLLEFGGVQYRSWDPHRSKLAAMILEGARDFGLDRKSKVLYLGAASGTTASHMSDIVTDGFVFCVEVSARVFRDLVKVCEQRKNMVPILADAGQPDHFAHEVEGVEFVYQDIAQKNQAEIFIRNMHAFEAEHGVLMVKARSIDVSEDPQKLFADVRRHLVTSNLEVRQVMDIGKYSKDHAAFIVEA